MIGSSIHYLKPCLRPPGGGCRHRRWRRSCVRPLSSISPHGSQWRPSAAETGNHRARVRVPSDARMPSISLRLHAGLDDGRHERREPRRCPTTFPEQFGVDGNVQPVEGMARVLDAAVHVRAADLAGVALDRRGRVNDLELVAVFERIRSRSLPRQRQRRRRRSRLWGFQHLEAAAGVVVGDIALDPDRDRLVLAFADQGAPGKAAQSLVSHRCQLPGACEQSWVFLLVCESPDLVDDDRAYRFPCLRASDRNFLVDLLELEDVGDHRVDLESFRPCTSRRSSARRCGRVLPRRRSPSTRGHGHELEWPGGNFLAGFSRRR